MSKGYFYESLPKPFKPGKILVSKYGGYYFNFQDGAGKTHCWPFASINSMKAAKAKMDVFIKHENKRSN